jgi:hypothetical protein
MARPKFNKGLCLLLRCKIIHDKFRIVFKQTLKLHVILRELPSNLVVKEPLFRHLFLVVIINLVLFSQLLPITLML